MDHVDGQLSAEPRPVLGAAAGGRCLGAVGAVYLQREADGEAHLGRRARLLHGSGWPCSMAVLPPDLFDAPVR
eukprot:6746049-Prymnesium_polylepis.1